MGLGPITHQVNGCVRFMNNSIPIFSWIESQIEQKKFKQVHLFDTEVIIANNHVV
jgi:hypothetical protein